jgi:hypothetical protein
MSEVSELRDIFFNRLEKTSYGRNQIKQLFDDCYFKVHSLAKAEINAPYGNSLINKLDVDKIINDAMTLVFGNTYSPNKKIRHNINDIELSEHFFNHKDNFISMFKDVTLTYTDTDIDIYYCNEHNIRMFKILYKV